MLKLAIINGPNLNLTGQREVHIYGTESFDEYIPILKAEFENQAEILYLQSNHEGEIIDKIQEWRNTKDALIINPGAYTHTSIAIRDALASLAIPIAEVHLSDINKRENFRKESLLKGISFIQISGFGMKSYEIAIKRLIEILK